MKKANTYLYTSTTNFYEKIEWLITQGVNVINMSNTTGGTAGAYTSIAKWIDHLAIQHSVHFVKSAGNSGPSGGITEPGMAYNIMTVGSINDHDSPNEPNWSDDTFSTYSSYVEDSSAAYKPDVTAPGEGITAGGLTGSGTSFSTPHVTGVIAQLINAYSTLATKQTAMKAILAGGTKHKTADDYGNNSLSPNYSNKEGAGVVDAKSSYYIAANTRYLSLQLYNSSFPYEKTFTVTSSDTLIRVSLAWLKRNSVSSPHSTGTITEKPLSDLDLEVYDPNGNLVGRSISGVNNVELVQFVPQMTGTYKIKVIGYSLKNDYEFIGLAWF